MSKPVVVALGVASIAAFGAALSWLLKSQDSSDERASQRPAGASARKADPSDERKQADPVLAADASIEEIVSALDANLRTAMLFLPRHGQGAQSTDELSLPGVLAIRSAARDSTFNQILCFGKMDAAVAQKAYTFVMTPERPVSWCLSPLGDVAAWTAQLGEWGITEQERLIAMRYPLPAQELPLRMLSGGAGIIRVQSRDHLSLLCHLWTRCGVDASAFQYLVSTPLDTIAGESSVVEVYLGVSAANEVLCSGMLVCSDGVAGLHGLVTAPSKRRQGFGAVMLRKLLSRAKRRGYAQVVVQAPEEAVRWYTEQGFQPLRFKDALLPASYQICRSMHAFGMGLE